MAPVRSGRKGNSLSLGPFLSLLRYKYLSYPTSAKEYDKVETHNLITKFSCYRNVFSNENATKKIANVNLSYNNLLHLNNDDKSRLVSNFTDFTKILIIFYW